MFSESITEIEGGPEIHVDHHSTLQLTCRVISGDKTPAYIIWQREDKVIIKHVSNPNCGGGLIMPVLLS